MNDISTKQNEVKQLQRLSAMRELYSSAKNYQGWQIILVVVMPIILVALSIIKPDIASYSAVYGVLIAIIDLTFFEESVKTRKNKAAKVQELFDCDVLELGCSPFKTCDEITVEEILFHYDAHSKVASNVEKIKDWYSGIDTQLPLSIARLICQRSNIRWDSNLRVRYVIGIRYFLFFAALILLFYGFLNTLKLIDLALLGSSLLPIFLFCIKQKSDQLDAVNRLNSFNSVITNLWNSILDGMVNDERLKESSRRLQDEIFEHRSKTPLIFDFIYDWFRTKDEDIMRRSNESLVDELRSKGII